MRVVKLRRPSALVKGREFARARISRLRPTAPQGGLPSVSLALSYPRFRIGGTEYKQSNLNRRLIDHRKSMARLEDVAFAATSVKKFVGVAAVDLFSQAVDVDLDRIREGIEGVVPDVGGDVGA